MKKQQKQQHHHRHQQQQNKNSTNNKYITAITDPILTKLEMIAITREITVMATKTETTIQQQQKKQHHI